MAGPAWRNVSITEQLAAAIDAYLAAHPEFKSRGQLVDVAVRAFLEEDWMTKVALRKALQAVASTNPETVEDFLRALLAELDDEVRKPPH